MRRIIVVEPSPFRRAETFVVGPMGRLRAWWYARTKLAAAFPFGAFQVLPETATVTLGERQLWPVAS